MEYLLLGYFYHSTLAAENASTERKMENGKATAGNEKNNKEGRAIL